MMRLVQAIVLVDGALEINLVIMELPITLRHSEQHYCEPPILLPTPVRLSISTLPQQTGNAILLCNLEIVGG